MTKDQKAIQVQMQQKSKEVTGGLLGRKRSSNRQTDKAQPVNPLLQGFIAQAKSQNVTRKPSRSKLDLASQIIQPQQPPKGSKRKQASIEGVPQPGKVNKQLQSVYQNINRGYPYDSMQSDEIDDSLWVLQNKNQRESKKKTKSRSNSRKGLKVQIEDTTHPKVNNFVESSMNDGKNMRMIGSGKINSSYSKNSGASQGKQNYMSSKTNATVSSRGKGQSHSRQNTQKSDSHNYFSQKPDLAQKHLTKNSSSNNSLIVPQRRKGKTQSSHVSPRFQTSHSSTDLLGHVSLLNDLKRHHQQKTASEITAIQSSMSNPVERRTKSQPTTKAPSPERAQNRNSQMENLIAMQNLVNNFQNLDQKSQQQLIQILINTQKNQEGIQAQTDQQSFGVRSSPQKNNLIHGQHHPNCSKIYDKRDFRAHGEPRALAADYGLATLNKDDADEEENQTVSYEQLSISECTRKMDSLDIIKGKALSGVIKHCNKRILEIQELQKQRPSTLPVISERLSIEENDLWEERMAKITGVED